MFFRGRCEGMRLRRIRLRLSREPRFRRDFPLNVFKRLGREPLSHTTSGRSRLLLRFSRLIMNFRLGQRLARQRLKRRDPRLLLAALGSLLFPAIIAVAAFPMPTFATVAAASATAAPLITTPTARKSRLIKRIWLLGF